jgi:expansin (peptidoglycan-binding protein)
MSAVLRRLAFALVVAAEGTGCGHGQATTLNAGGNSASATGATGATGSSTGAAVTSVAATTGTALVLYGSPYSGGQYNLGPVDYAETQFHNACAPGSKYRADVQAAEGDLLAGLWDGIPNVAGYCDACIFVTTAKGASSVLRVVTYGQTSTNSIDTSPSAYGVLNMNEYPRAMTWQFAKCPDTGAMMYEFQSGSNAYWTSLWVRNARVPLSKVEVQSVNHASFVALQRGGDGTLTDAAGFGSGSFTLRSTGVDGQVVTDTFAWPANGIASAFLTGKGNFQ